MLIHGLHDKVLFGRRVWLENHGTITRMEEGGLRVNNNGLVEIETGDIRLDGEGLHGGEFVVSENKGLRLGAPGSSAFTDEECLTIDNSRIHHLDNALKILFFINAFDEGGLRTESSRR